MCIKQELPAEAFNQKREPLTKNCTERDHLIY